MNSMETYIRKHFPNPLDITTMGDLMEFIIDSIDDIDPQTNLSDIELHCDGGSIKFTSLPHLADGVTTIGDLIEVCKSNDSHTNSNYDLGVTIGFIDVSTKDGHDIFGYERPELIASKEEVESDDGDNERSEPERHYLVRVTVQTLIDALSKIEDKEQYIVVSQDPDNFTYLQSAFELTDPLEEDRVVALVGSDKAPSKYFTPNKVL